jgi:Colon cancer-associated protein Mic1-like
VLDKRDYPTFQMLMQYHVLNENLELARLLINLGSKDNAGEEEEEKSAPDGAAPLYYEPAYQAGLDMMKKLKTYDEIVVALINEGLTLRALNFAQAYNIHSMKLTSFLAVVDQLRTDGKNHEADILFKRIAEIRKYDEVKLITDPGHKSILVEE